MQYTFARQFLIGRYDHFPSDAATGDDPSGLSLGAGWVVLEPCELRFEHRFGWGLEEDATFVQLVAAF